MPAPDPQKTSVLFLVLAWAVVAVPLAWGLYQSVEKALPLFIGIKVP